MHIIYQLTPEKYFYQTYFILLFKILITRSWSYIFNKIKQLYQISKKHIPVLSNVPSTSV